MADVPSVKEQREEKVSGLILSLFSGIGALDEGFRQAGYCVVSAGDLIFSSLYDVRNFHGPPGRFDGLIAGDPCQSHSSLANLVRAKGLEPRFPDMTPEVVRVIEEARPAWFLRENVPQAPLPAPEGYDVRSFLLDHSTLDAGDGTGHEQMRRRRFCFGVRGDLGPCPELRAHIDFALFVLPEAETFRPSAGLAGPGMSPGTPAEAYRARRQASVGASPEENYGRNHSPKAKLRRQTAVAGNDGHGDMLGDKTYRAARAAKQQAVGSVEKDYAPPRRSLEDMLDLQGLPRDLFEHSPLTMQGKRKGVGNAVALPMAVALGRAVRKAVG